MIEEIRKLMEDLKQSPTQDMSSRLAEIADGLKLREIHNFLKNNPLSHFPYNFTKNYIGRDVPTYYDSSLEMIYIVENDRKLYFKRGMSKEEVICLYNALGMEQDHLSPHRYLTDEIHMLGTIPANALTRGFTINPGDVAVDLGVAEGNFAFSIIDIVSKIYLFECDMEWVRALEATFRDYNDKVAIVSKYVSDVDDENNVSLDNYFSSADTVNFIKADIEGFECQALLGMQKILQKNTDIRAAICTYHFQDDAESFSDFFKKIGFSVSFTPGYMLFQNIDTPVQTRKGVLRASKKTAI